MNCAVIINGYYESPAQEYQISRLKEEFGRRGVILPVIKNNKGILIGNEAEEGSLDFAVFLDKDVDLAYSLERRDVRLYNRAKAVEDCDSKVRTCVLLANCPGVVQPDTVIAPLRYKQGIDYKFLDSVEKKLGYPVIVKRAVSSLGAGVYLADNREKLESLSFMLSAERHLYQRFISESRGKSVRAYVIGGKFFCGVLIENKNDFRSNAGLGGKASPFDFTAEYIQAAESAAEYLNLNYCAVDFLIGGSVIEVNSNAYFTETERVTGLNIAGAYAEYIINDIKFRQSKL